MKSSQEVPKKKYLKLLAIIYYIFYLMPDTHANSNIIRLTASSGNYSDETIIRLKEEATFGFDEDWDAFKLNNGGNTPNLYTLLDGKKYVINSISYSTHSDP